jgi:hypoxanthine phosphoribosyltransferase
MNKNFNGLPCGLKKIVVSEEEIRGIISRMAKEITRDYSGKKLLVCGILKGSFIFLADLVRQLGLPPDMTHISFIKASSYGSGRNPGEVKITEISDLSGYADNNYDILIVDDILDTGSTFCFLKKYLADKGFGSVEFCAFLDKPERREQPFEAKYTGKRIENEFVVGYGLDFDEKYRTLPYVAAVE